jgi:hypothetical protein
MAVAMEGWLEKKGGVRTNWNQRWFVLDSSARTLQYLDKPGGSCKGSIDVSGATVRASEAPKAWPHELEIVTEERVYRVRGTSDSERDAWIDAMIAGQGGAAVAVGGAAHGGGGGRVDPLPSQLNSGGSISGPPQGSLEERMQEMNGFYDGNASTVRLVHDRWDENWADGRDMDGEALLKELGAQYKRQGKVFSDTKFPPADSSLYMDHKTGKKLNRGRNNTGGMGAGYLSSHRRDQRAFLAGREVVWKAPSELMNPAAKPVIFSGGIEPDDINQGELGGARPFWFLLSSSFHAADWTGII